jgi:hypothetical protein
VNIVFDGGLCSNRDDDEGWLKTSWSGGKCEYDMSCVSMNRAMVYANSKRPINLVCILYFLSLNERHVTRVLFECVSTESGPLAVYARMWIQFALFLFHASGLH